MGETYTVINSVKYPVASDKEGLLWRVADVGGEVSETWDDWSGGMGECERKSRKGYYFSDGWDATLEGVLRFSSSIKSLISAGLSTGHGYFFEKAGTTASTLTFDAASSGSSSTASLSFSHTTGTGENRLMIVSQGTQGGATSLTYGGRSFTQLGTSTISGVVGSAMWYMLNPPSGAHTISATFTGTLRNILAVTTFSGVNQSAPFGTAVSAKSAAGSTAPTVTVSTTTGEIVIDHVAADNGPTAAEGASQTERHDVAIGSDIRLAASTQAGADGGVMSWTLGTSQPWVMFAIPIKPATPPYIYCCDASGTYLSSTAGAAIWKLQYDSDTGITEVGALAASTATAGSTSTTLEDSTAPFGGASAYVNRIVKLTGGTGAGQYRRIASHDSNTLTVSAWDITPSTDTTYQVLDSHWVASADFGRPVYFIGKWKVPSGVGVNTEELTTAAAPLGLDTWTSKADPDALHFSTYQKGTGAHIAGATTGSTIGSAATADTALTALGTIGDTSTSITDLVETQGFLIIPKEDGVYEMDSDGVARPVDIGLARANVDNSNGRTSVAFGDEVILPYNSLLRYRIGSGVIPIGLEELKGFRRVENTGIVPPKDRRPVACARAGKYIYTCYNSTTKSLLVQGRPREDGDPPGPEKVWHSIRDLSLCKGMGVDSKNRLWLKGADPDGTQRAFHVIELDTQGGLDTQYRRGAISETYTHNGDEWIPNDGEQVQLRTFEIWTAGGWSAQTSLALQVYRDSGNTAEDVGSAITAAGVTINNWTTGTTDTAYRVRPVLVVTTGATYAPLITDPTVLRFRIKGRKPMIYRCVIPADRDMLSNYALTPDTVRENLYRLQDQGVVAIQEPGQTATFQGEVIGVADRRIVTEYGVTMAIELAIRRYIQD